MKSRVFRILLLSLALVSSACTGRGGDDTVAELAIAGGGKIALRTESGAVATLVEGQYLVRLSPGVIGARAPR